MKYYKNHREFFLDELRKDPNNIKLYLEVAIKDFEKTKDIKSFLLALRTIAEAKGGMTALENKTKFTRQGLYKALSYRGNPRLDTIWKILIAFGFSISIKPLNITDI